MSKEKFINKEESNEDLTAESIVEHKKIVKPQVNIYGKYGTLANKYLEEYNQVKLNVLGSSLPQYLHEIDCQAEKMYIEYYRRLSCRKKYKKTGDAELDALKEQEIQSMIECAIIRELIYEDYEIKSLEELSFAYDKRIVAIKLLKVLGRKGFLPDEVKGELNLMEQRYFKE